MDDTGLRFGILGSGSRGNAALIECATTTLMLDAGFSARETLLRLARFDRSGEQLSAILITHEHGDHCRGVVSCARQFGIPVWMTAGTLSAMKDDVRDSLDVHVINPHEIFSIGDIEVQPFPVPHDAREPCQFVFSNGDVRLGFLTDTGSITPHIEAMLNGCEALVLECNHDLRMLRDGPYSPSLKARVGGNHGHLDNATTAGLLRRLDSSCIRQIVAAHLSETNNTPELARAALARAFDCDPEFIQVADQEAGLPFRSISHAWV